MPMESKVLPLSAAVGAHAVCFLGLIVSSWISHVVYDMSLASDPVGFLRLALAVQVPLVIGIYSSLRDDAQDSSYWRAVGRGLLGLPVGAFLNAVGAIVLGAPLGLSYWTKTTNWSLLMSLFTFVPAVCAFGSSKKDWRRLLDFSRITERLDYMISLPAHGSIIGGWIGAWPMPLDWERPWQEWPVCVTYGAVAGYFLGMLTSIAFIVFKKSHLKRD